MFAKVYFPISGFPMLYFPGGRVPVGYNSARFFPKRFFPTSYYNARSGFVGFFSVKFFPGHRDESPR